MDRRRFLASAALVTAGSGLAKAPRRPPNFVVILCDDLGYGDVQALGGTTIMTPNIDRMAADGLTFTDFYAAANICTPSRAGLLTGRYAARMGLAHEVIAANEDRGLPASEVTIAQALKPAYVSGLFGKWHLGHRGTAWPPTTRGFDRFVGLPYSHDMSPLALYSIDRGGPLRQEPVDYPRLQQRFYEEAERFITENATRPFFVELALSAPHLPEYPNAAFHGRSRAGAYGDVVEEIDSIVGRLRAKLAQLGLERDTLVLFTSDNGPWFEGSAGRLRDRKGGAGLDGGYRVPLVACRPGVVPAGMRTAAISMSIDFLPTFCAMASVRPPARVELDGRDISPLLTGTAAVSPHDALLLFDNDAPVAIRTQRWKYVAAQYYRGHLANIEPRYPQLYDVAADPTESYNLADRYPEVFADLKERLAAARAQFAISS